MTILRSKLTLVALGILLFGGAGGMLAARSAGQPQVTANSSSGPSSPRPPTATARSVTPTHAANQIVRLQGTVGSVHASADSFVLTVGGSAITCIVTSSTTWDSTVPGIGSLQQGMQASVHGHYQTGGTFLATRVNADT